jgi:hypothetical protein
MKKLLVLALAVVLTLSLTVVATAATFDPYVGGVFQLTYLGDDANEDTPIQLLEDGDRSMVKAYVTGTVKDEETNTWAKIGARLHAWSAGADYNPVFEAGIKQIGDALDIWYTNDENDKTLRGQERLYYAAPHKFGPDPIFCHRLGNVFGFDFGNDNVDVNVVYNPNKNSIDKNEIALSATFKFDAGKAYVGTWTGTSSIDPDENVEGDEYDEKMSETIIGGEFKAGFGTINADYLSKKPDETEKGSLIQASVGIDSINLKVTALMDDKYVFATDGGTGFGLEWTGIEKLTIGYKALTAKEDADEGGNLSDIYVGYKFGIFNTRIGSAKMGDGDNFVYATAQVNMW